MCQNLWPDELKILVIDDEQEILNLIRLSLEQAGFRVIRTTKAEEGLALVLQAKPDLLLLDVMMPDLDGLELLRRVRRHPAMGQVPVIIVSARASNINQQRMLQLSLSEQDVAAFVGKPFNPGDLVQTVKEVLIQHKEFILAKNKKTEKRWAEQTIF
jgi:two-component system response regulator AdeR